MAQGQIRKGFFFYFGIFVLICIAVFMCCLVMMMFNPGKTILWMQYFTANETFVLEKTTDDLERPIVLTDISDMEIRCSYANVSVIRSKDRLEDGIYIVNKAKGFMAAKEAQKFEVLAHFEGSKLILEIKEPNGFLFLSKDIEIILNAYIDRTLDFSNLNLTVTTGKGNINIGGGIQKAENVKLKSLHATSDSGYINLNKTCDASAMRNNGEFGLSLSTNKGQIASYMTVATDTLGISTSCNVALSNTNGRINFGMVKANSLTLDCQKGDVAIDNIKASDTKVKNTQGNYRFKKIEGNLSYSNAENYLMSPNIMADHITGNFTLVGNESSKPDIRIKKIDGDIDILVDNGNVNIDEANGAISIQSNGDLPINIVVGEGRRSTDTILISNVSGNINLSFLNKVLGNVELKTKNNNVTINVTAQAKFTANAYKNNEVGQTDENKIPDANVSVNWGTTGSISKNPFSPNKDVVGENGNVTIFTNKNVYYNLKTAAQIKGQEAV